MINFLQKTVFASAFFALFVMALTVGLDKEAKRMDAVREYNCKHYGTHINREAGREVCPPTPQG